MKTIFCLFQDFESAKRAVAELMANRFNDNYLNLIVQEQSAKNAVPLRGKHSNGKNGIPNTGQKRPGLDEMMTGKNAVQINDTGKVLAIGELASFISRSAAGANLGNGETGLLAALIDFGLGKDTARHYFTGVKGGGYLLFLRTEDERASEAASLLRSQEGKSIVSHAG